MVETHTHNKTDSPPVAFKDLTLPLPTAITALPSLTAGTSYTTNEQAMLNNHQANIAQIIAVLKSLGFIQ
jgi:hypothetical protein